MLGGEICRLLAERGSAVRALVRDSSNPERIERLRNLGAEVVRGDLKDRASLETACRGARAVFQLRRRRCRGGKVIPSRVSTARAN